MPPPQFVPAVLPLDTWLIATPVAANAGTRLMESLRLNMIGNSHLFATVLAVLLVVPLDGLLFAYTSSYTKRLYSASTLIPRRAGRASSIVSPAVYRFVWGTIPKQVPTTVVGARGHVESLGLRLEVRGAPTMTPNLGICAHSGENDRNTQTQESVVNPRTIKNIARFNQTRAQERRFRNYTVGVECPTTPGESAYER